MFGKPKSDFDTVQRAAITQAIIGASKTAMAKRASSEPARGIASISRGTTIVGKIVCDGVMNILGRIEGEVCGGSVNVCEGACVDGKLVAEELTVGGSVRGTIEATRVKLQSTAGVDGEIRYQLLSIEDNARFDGMSKCVTEGLDVQSSVQSSARWPLQIRAETQSDVVPIATSLKVANE